MTQRLGLAVAILAESPILLLDEPTAALDPDGLCAFYGLIDARRHHGQTVVFSSHQMGDVERLADRFVVLVGGRLVASLTARELVTELADRGVMKISLERCPPNLLDDVRRIAPKAVWVADQLIVPAPMADRLAVLDIARGSGAGVVGLSAEEGRLDVYYRELVGGQR
jgi:Cu-processing system ATP-binding protein